MTLVEQVDRVMARHVRIIEAPEITLMDSENRRHTAWWLTLIAVLVVMAVLLETAQ
jgi:hypothetical protein